jgi:two-component system capsular synthesis response regulator RcsB
MKPITRVIVADDHSCVRLGVRHLLEAVPFVSIVGEAWDTQTLAELVDTCPCDVVVSDIGMPDLETRRRPCGVSCGTRRIRASWC